MIGKSNTRLVCICKKCMAGWALARIIKDLHITLNLHS